MKLLIVDDEVDLCALLRDHFEEHFEGEVFTATTPGEALRLLEQLQPEGMLLDINCVRGSTALMSLAARLKSVLEQK
jgi:DNA-binding response OmpR family regulator